MEKTEVFAEEVLKQIAFSFCTFVRAFSQKLKILKNTANRRFNAVKPFLEQSSNNPRTKPP